MKDVYRAVRQVKRRTGKFLCRYINGTQGVISLFLAILMVPFVSVAGALINAARINSTIAVFDEALCNASNSTLGTYDEFLKKRFGLLAMAQDGVGGNYTGQNFIADTFQFYMEQNLNVLSNTYLESQSEANGVYPLADPDVLLASLMEYSKYTVPTKMVADALPLDSLLSDLTESFSVVSGGLNVFSSTLDVGVSLDTCQTDLQALKERLDECVVLKGSYDTNYTEFNGATTQYNNALSTMKTEVDAAWVKVNEAREKVAHAQEALDAAGEDVDISGLQEALAAAEAELKAAEAELEAVVSNHRVKLDAANTNAETRKNSYIQALTELRKKIEETRDATLKAQKSVNEVVSSGAKFAEDVTTTVIASKIDAAKKNEETLKNMQKAAEESGNTQVANVWEQKMNETDKHKNELKYTNTAVEEGSKAASGAAEDIAEFGKKKLEEEYNKILQDIDNLLAKANAYEIPVDGKNPQDLTAENYTGYNAMAATESCYKDLQLPQKAEDVVDMMTKYATELMSSSFLAIVKAILKFIQAMLTVDIWMNPLLCSSLTSGSFSSVGGLPSKKSASAYASPFASTDKQQSDYYKSVMGSYSTNALNTGSVNGFIETVNALKRDVNQIIEVWDSDIQWYNILFKLGETIALAISIVKNLLSLMGQIIQVIATAVYNKVLLAGYLGYNTANRTTYGDSALTGEKYNLPGLGSGMEGKCLYGAETEYIIMGDESETANQIYLFYIIYLIRVLVNLPVVIMNGEVQTIAAAAGSVTFGFGTLLVYVLYFLAEPLVDTLILVNGGSIPFVKIIAYLTPSGVDDLVKAVTSLKMTEAQTTMARSSLANVMSCQGVNADFGKTYAEEMDVFGDGSDSTASKVSGMFEMNYTHMLILIMLFIPTETMVKRLGDIIQMEATHNGDGDFDLTHSYTYLRASGKFSTSEFIKLSDSGQLNSPERIVYRGY